MNNGAGRFFGGPPLWVLVRLILLSILVGVILSALGFDPLNIFRSIERLIRGIWEMGWDAVSWVWRYFLLGAVLVIPIWLIMRLVKAPARRG
jgi:NADH:ubiquinone oxidoreductase subunit 5 (subunit L)/multisubunit Na+/H+ antiporter MnhA subunit